MKPYYEDGSVTIYHGDALDVLPTFGAGSFGAFVTDPPYTAAGGSSNGRSSDEDDQFFAFWMRHVSAEIRRVTSAAGCGFVFCDWRTVGVVRRAFRDPGDRQTAPGWEVTQALVWDRDHVGMGSPFRNSFEMIAFAKGPQWNRDHLPRNIRTVIRHPWPYGAKEHGGAEKPVALNAELIRWTGTRGRVLDPFVGSGPALLAARQLGLAAVGVSKSERDCEIAAKRCAQEVLELGAA